MSVTPEVITLDHSPCLWLTALAERKKGRERRTQTWKIELTYHTSAQKTHLRKGIMKSIVSFSAVVVASRFIGFAAVMAVAALPAFGAGSAKQPVRKDGDPSIAIYNQGVELMLAKQFAAAQAKFEQAVKENPGFAEAHNNLGYTLRKQGAANYQKSLGHYNTAIALKPKLAEAYMYRGVLYTEMGRKVDAQADLAALQKLNPQLAKELAEVIKTGKEEGQFYGLSRKISG
jgi:tetratricopeptide (TPR) repeat protein